MARGARDVTAVPRPLQGERKESLGKGEKRVETWSWRGQSTAGRRAGSFSLLLLFFKAIFCFLWSLRPGEHRGALHIKHSVAWLRCTQCPQPLHPMQLLLGRAQHPQNPARMGPAWGEARSDLRDAFAPLDPLLELLGGFCSQCRGSALPKPGEAQLQQLGARSNLVKLNAFTPNAELNRPAER